MSMAGGHSAFGCCNAGSRKPLRPPLARFTLLSRNGRGCGKFDL